MSSSSPERATEKQRAKREAVVTEEKGKQFPKNGKLTFSGLLFPRKQTEKILRLPCQKRGSFGEIAACNGCSFKQNCLREKAAKPGEDARRPGGPSETGQGRRGPGVTLTRPRPHSTPSCRGSHGRGARGSPDFGVQSPRPSPVPK